MHGPTERQVEMPPTPKSDAGLSSPGMHRRQTRRTDRSAEARRSRGQKPTPHRRSRNRKPMRTSRGRNTSRLSVSRSVRAACWRESSSGSDEEAPPYAPVSFRWASACPPTANALHAQPQARLALGRPTSDRIFSDSDSSVSSYAASFLFKSRANYLKMVHLIASSRVCTLYGFYQVGALTAHIGRPRLMPRLDRGPHDCSLVLDG